MAKQIFILFTIVAGFFLMPKQTYACGSKSATVEISSCKEGLVCDQENEFCCAEHSGRRTNHDCGGQCNHSGCHCPTVNVVPLPNNSGIKKHILTKETNQNHLLNFVLSSGFHSIWIPPKIS